MICLWYQGKYVDGWFNTISDTDFMEVTMIKLDLNPANCDWVEYSGNPNGHNPKQVDDANKSFEWIVGEKAPTAIITNPNDIPAIQKQYYSAKVFEFLSRILYKQNAILESNFLDTEEVPPIPDQFIAPTTVENKVVMNPMQTLTVQDEVFTLGQRKKLYAGETSLPPKFANLREIAVHLLGRKTKWSEEFKNKLLEIQRTVDV